MLLTLVALEGMAAPELVEPLVTELPTTVTATSVLQAAPLFPQAFTCTV